MAENIKNIKRKDRVGFNDNLFRELYEFSPLMHFIIDSEGYVLSANKNGAKVLGYKHDELIGQQVLDVFHPDDKKLVLKQIRECLKEPNKIHNWELRKIRKDGNVLWVKESARVISEDGQKFIFIICEDISEQKKAKASVVEWRNRYEAAINASSQLLYDWDTLTNKVTYGGDLERILGYSENEIQDDLNHWLELIHPEDIEQFQDELDRVVNKKEPFNLEYRVRKKGGDYIVVEDKGFFFMDSDEEKSRMVGFVADITQRKNIEEELLRAKKLESLGVLAGGIAHDFNNLLTSIIGNLSIAKTHPKIDDQLLQLFSEIEDATDRASDLVAQFLTFSKGGAPVKKLVSNFDDFICDVANFAVSGSKSKCEFSIEDGLWNIELDESHISQVIENIVINAQQSMPDGGTIKVNVINLLVKKTDKIQPGSGKYIKITIEDNGIGIDQKDLDKIFDPYYTTKEQGHGLGLSSVYSIVTNHGGNIDVESKLGVGTKFHIYLPSSDKLAKSKSSPKKSVSYGKGRILLMDDEALIRKATGRMLKKIGYDVDYASDGVEAIDKYKQAKENNPFDVVIMDLTIPGGMGGSEAIKILRSLDPNIRAVVSSGYYNDPVLSDYQKFGFNAIVKKPYRIEVLSETIINVLKDTSH